MKFLKNDEGLRVTVNRHNSIQFGRVNSRNLLGRHLGTPFPIRTGDRENGCLWTFSIASRTLGLKKTSPEVLFASGFVSQSAALAHDTLNSS